MSSEQAIKFPARIDVNLSINIDLEGWKKEGPEQIQRQQEEGGSIPSVLDRGPSTSMLALGDGENVGTLEARKDEEEAERPKFMSPMGEMFMTKWQERSSTIDTLSTHTSLLASDQDETPDFVDFAMDDSNAKAKSSGPWIEKNEENSGDGRSMSGSRDSPKSDDEKIPETEWGEKEGAMSNSGKSEPSGEENDVSDSAIINGVPGGSTSIDSRPSMVDISSSVFSRAEFDAAICECGIDKVVAECIEYSIDHTPTPIEESNGGDQVENAESIQPIMMASTTMGESEQKNKSPCNKSRLLGGSSTIEPGSKKKPVSLHNQKCMNHPRWVNRSP